MRYNGGKHSIRKELAAIFNSYKPSKYWEPFVGAGSVINEVVAEYKLGTDLDVSIISLINAVKNGWQPPETLSEEEYREAKKLPETDPVHGFAKYGCSFGGKPWGGYARSADRNYAKNAKNSLLKDRKRYLTAEFKVAGYQDIDYRDFDLIYCDPPYRGTTSVGCGKPFDHDDFWYWVRKISKHATVFVTELQAPEGFEVVWEKQLNDGLGKTKIKERLFKIK